PKSMILSGRNWLTIRRTICRISFLSRESAVRIGTSLSFAAQSAASAEKPAALHHLLAVDPDVEVAADAVDVGGGGPGLAGVLGVGMAEGEVDAGELLVLQDIAADVGDGEVGPDAELAHAVA